MKTVQAKFENGVFRPLDKVDIPAGARVELIIREPDDDPVSVLRARYPKSFGGLSRDEGEAMIQAIDAEFEKIDPNAWK